MTSVIYTPDNPDAVVSEVRFYDSPERLVPVVTAIPVGVGSQWTAEATLQDGDYYTAWDVTDAAGFFTDSNDFFYVQQGELVPGSQVVSMADIRRHLFLDNPTDKSYDGQLIGWLETAVELVEHYTDIPLTPDTRTKTGHFPRVLLSTRAVRNVVSVTTANGSDVTGYELLPSGELQLPSSAYGSVTVTYVAGLRRLPALLREVILDLVRLRYDTRSSALPRDVRVAEEDITPIFPINDQSILSRLDTSHRRGARVG